MKDDIKNYYDKLKDSLVFNFSLHSKELFHSNLWAWLIEHDRAFSKVFFDKLNDDDINHLTVKREEGNKVELKNGSKIGKRDISIHINDQITGNKIYVIENKFKSIPTVEQLKEYEKSIKEKKDQEFCEGVLTGIKITSSLKAEIKNSGWKFLSYKDISEKIRNQIKSSNKINEDDKKILKNYCDVLDSLNEILKLNLSQNGISDAPNYDLAKLDCSGLKCLEELRIYDIYQKILFCEFEEYIQSQLNTCKELNPSKITYEHIFTNGKAGLDIGYKNDAKDFWIGLEIQNNQYKICVEDKTKNKEKGCECVFTNYKNEGWFEKYSKSLKEIRKNKSSMKNKSGFNKYKKSENGKTFYFVYQYYNLNDGNNTFSQIFEQIKMDLTAAKKIFEKKYK